MLHDSMLLWERRGSATSDRRESLRARCLAEATVCWQDNPFIVCRYPAEDVSDGGMRIRSALPMLEGSVGRALKLLPSGRDLERAVMVIWCRRDDESNRYEIGLRFF
jgi:hypothetical protein